MERFATFWSAFWAGLAAPTMLFTPPAPYAAYAPPRSVSESFATVGAMLGRMIQSAPVSDPRDTGRG
jgi:hypothetical protein